MGSYTRFVPYKTPRLALPSWLIKVPNNLLCEGNLSRKLARNFSTFLKFLEGSFFRKSFANLNGVTDFSQRKNFKNH